MKHDSNRFGIFLALLSAVCYAVNAPFSKILLAYIPSTLMAGFLYIGAGMAMVGVKVFQDKALKRNTEKRLSKAELPYVIAMVALDIAAPIFLMFGLRTTNAANASLLTNFETVATAMIALFFFRETISTRLWTGITFFTFSSILLSVEDLSALRFSIGSLFIILAYSLWGIENNCTRKLSSKNPCQIVLIKGFCSGVGSLAIGLALGERLSAVWPIVATLLLGSVAFGMSSYLYVYAQRFLGASRTSAYYSAAPFIGSVLSFVVFREMPGLQYLIAFAMMIFGAILSSSDRNFFMSKKRT
ncbi:MAG: DMT family transporter [Sphaerochaeta sp.]|nr:DMT family transporter [Sphaerochaeta sp.]